MRGRGAAQRPVLRISASAPLPRRKGPGVWQTLGPCLGLAGWAGEERREALGDGRGQLPLQSLWWETGG